MDHRVEWFTNFEIATWRPEGNAALTNNDYREHTAEFEIVIGKT
jgi:hypothetical protein